ncbi:MAG: DUF4184 family protein [Microthrixaceae bacterium]
MPLTFPAHQAAVLPIKLRWPNRTDATAMCIGAAAPDLLKPAPAIGLYSHSVIGVLVFAVPLTYVICTFLRRRSAQGVFANLPDAGQLRLHSYRVIAQRRPSTSTTLLSALLGGWSHSFIDAFTHEGGWGVDLLGLDVTLFTLPIRGAITGAKVLQYLGHGLGSLIAIGMFYYIGRSRCLEHWYGARAVRSARSFSMPLKARVQFWMVFAGVAAIISAGLIAVGGPAIFCIIDGIVAGALAAGALPIGGRDGLQPATVIVDMGDEPISPAGPGTQPDRSA